MRRLFSKAYLRALSSILALVVLLGSSPLTTGVIILSGPIQPEITMNICHPIQTLDLVSSILLARPAAAKPESLLCDFGSAIAMAAPRLIENRGQPDTPPPKLSF